MKNIKKNIVFNFIKKNILMISIFVIIIIICYLQKKSKENFVINKLIKSSKVKILFFNDCGPVGHSGSKAVTSVIEQYLNNNFNIEKITKVTRYNHRKHTDFNYDFIIVNGEGALHNNQKDIVDLLKYIYDIKLPKFLLNTCFYNMDINKKYLTQFDLIYTREVISHQELLKNYNIKSILLLDLTFYYFKFFNKQNINDINEYYNKILITNFNQFKIKFYDILNILNEYNIKVIRYHKFKKLNWQDNISNFSNSKMVITDMQHVMINCILSNTKFICFTSNIPKNEGILKTFNCKIPIIKDNKHFKSEIFNFINGKYDNEFKKLFDKANDLKLNLEVTNFKNEYRNNINLKVLLIGNSTEPMSNIDIKEYDNIVVFNNFNSNYKYNTYIINSINLKNEYNKKLKINKNLKLIIGDQKNILSIHNKIVNEYISNVFLSKMRNKYKSEKNFSLGLCSILYYLFWKNYNKVYITNFNLDLKYNKNKFTNTNLSNSHDFLNEKKIIKKLIKEGRIVNL